MSAGSAEGVPAPQDGAGAAISGYIDMATLMTIKALAVVFGNEKVNEIAEQIANFVKYNWQVLFTVVAVLSFWLSPIPFALGLGMGYWAFDKTFTVMPGNLSFSPHVLIDPNTPKNQLTSLTLSVVSRFVIAGPISSWAVGFLAGCEVRRLLVGAPPALAHAPLAH